MTAPYPALVEGSRVALLIAQAVEQEREACARVADNLSCGASAPWVYMDNVATAIRARGSAA